MKKGGDGSSAAPFGKSAAGGFGKAAPTMKSMKSGPVGGSGGGAGGGMGGPGGLGGSGPAMMKGQPGTMKSGPAFGGMDSSSSMKGAESSPSGPSSPGSSFGFGGMMKKGGDGSSAAPFGKSAAGGFSGSRPLSDSNMPPNKGSFGITSKTSSFGNPTSRSGEGEFSNNPSPRRASEVSSILSSLANDEPQRRSSQPMSSRGPSNRMAMPSPIGQLNLESSVRDSGLKPGPDTFLGSLASGSGDQTNSRSRGSTNDINRPGNGGVQAGGNTVGGFRPLSVTITDPRTGKKRTISVSSLSDTTE